MSSVNRLKNYSSDFTVVMITQFYKEPCVFSVLILNFLNHLNQKQIVLLPLERVFW